MKSALSVTLVASLLLTSLAAAAEPQNISRSPLSNWSRVRSIVAGSRINAAYVGRRQDRQHFISATDEAMTVLTPERLPRAAREALIRIAETQPGFFTATKWAEFTDGSVHVTPDGIYVKRHRVAALEDVVTTVERGDVEEVSREIRVRRPLPRAPMLGTDPIAETTAIGGSVAGTMLLYGTCGESCPTWAYLAAIMGPIVAGVAILAKHRDRVTEIVYRAP